MEKLRNYHYQNGMYTLTLENIETGEINTIITNKEYEFARDGIHYIALSSQ